MKLTGFRLATQMSNQLGKMVVGFTWKGISCLRTWVKPANPNSTQQGYARDVIRILAQTAYSINKLRTAAYYHPENSLVDIAEIKAVAVTPNTWISWFMKKCIGLGAWNDAGTTMPAAWKAAVAIWTDLAGTDRDAWDSDAKAAPHQFVDIDSDALDNSDWASTDKEYNIAGFQLFMNEWGLYMMGLVNIPTLTPPAYTTG